MSARPDPGEFNVTIRDETLHSTEVTEILLRLCSYRLPARDLISERVEAECDERLADKAGHTGPRPVQTDEVEKTLNTGTSPRAPDVGKRIALALSAFENNGFVLLVDDRQIETLEEEIDISESSIVTFLKLTPLVGG